jgi:endonuclease YncB( thermonuclease family)
MISISATRAAAILLAGVVASPALSADIVSEQLPREQNAHVSQGAGPLGTITGRVAVMDGRTLWFPEHRKQVRLAEIDACELPQWAYDPKLPRGSNIPKPVPCGPFARAWLKRTVGSAVVTCSTLSYADDGALVGRCALAGRDLALEMLRVGWARLNAPSPLRPEYLAWQQYAMEARYGMWATYVLDMDEWRAKAVDRTLARKPIADFNLLAERENEISPPFQDARNHPSRTDR